MGIKRLRGQFELIPTWLPIFMSALALVSGAGVAWGVVTWKTTHLEAVTADHEIRLRSHDEKFGVVDRNMSSAAEDTRAIRQALFDAGFKIVPRADKQQ